LEQNSENPIQASLKERGFATPHKTSSEHHPFPQMVEEKSIQTNKHSKIRKKKTAAIQQGVVAFSCGAFA